MAPGPPRGDRHGDPGDVAEADRCGKGCGKSLEVVDCAWVILIVEIAPDDGHTVCERNEGPELGPNYQESADAEDDVEDRVVPKDAVDR